MMKIVVLQAGKRIEVEAGNEVITSLRSAHPYRGVHGPWSIAEVEAVVQVLAQEQLDTLAALAALK